MNLGADIVSNPSETRPLVPRGDRSLSFPKLRSKIRQRSIIRGVTGTAAHVLTHGASTSYGQETFNLTPGVSQQTFEKPLVIFHLKLGPHLKPQQAGVTYLVKRELPEIIAAFPENRADERTWSDISFTAVIVRTHRQIDPDLLADRIPRANILKRPEGCRERRPDQKIWGGGDQ